MAQRLPHEQAPPPHRHAPPREDGRPTARILPFPQMNPRPPVAPPPRPSRTLAAQDRVLLGIAILAAAAAAIVAGMG